MSFHISEIAPRILPGINFLSGPFRFVFIKGGLLGLIFVTVSVNLTTEGSLGTCCRMVFSSAPVLKF